MALAAQSLKSGEDQATAIALQRSLVPSALPTVRGAEVAARYVPGAGRVGDWYDVFVLSSGELAMVVGRRCEVRARRRGHKDLGVALLE